jgi:hypothetical protein
MIGGKRQYSSFQAVAIRTLKCPESHRSSSPLITIGPNLVQGHRADRNSLREQSSSLRTIVLDRGRCPNWCLRFF